VLDPSTILALRDCESMLASSLTLTVVSDYVYR